ncbi:MAG TPA: hypothetical protein VIO60_07365, partial [Rectinemataceae bacterium]
MNRLHMIFGTLHKKGPARTGILVLVLASALGVGLVSCSKSYNRYLRLPTDPEASDLGWALVRSAYAKIKESPDPGSRDLGVLRAGQVFPVAGRRIDPRGAVAGGYWFKHAESGIEGWVWSGDLDLYASEAG